MWRYASDSLVETTENGYDLLIPDVQWGLFSSAGTALFIEYCIVHRFSERLAKTPLIS